MYRIPSILLLATTLDCNGTRIGSPKRDKNGRHHPERSLGSTSSKEKKEKSHEALTTKKAYVRDESIALVSCIIIIIYLDIYDV